MAERLSHPDIHLVFPVPTTLKPAELAELVASYARDGYREVDFGRKSAIISVDTILNEMVVKANQRPYIGPWKVFVIADADAMTTEAANTLLKTLEEPSEQTVITLTTSRPNALPATVVSRCQSVQFSALSKSVVRDILLGDSRFSFDEGTAAEAASLSQGSVGRAVRMEKSGPTVDTERVAELMAGRRMRDVPALINEATGLAFRLGRAEQERVLELMLLWFRDVLSVSQIGGEAEGDGLLYSGHVRELTAQAKAMDVEVVAHLVDRIDDARRAIERYSNPAIVFTSVLLDIAIARKQSATRGVRNHAA
jgi:DNA polymerase-3 subunit delta'